MPSSCLASLPIKFLLICSCIYLEQVSLKALLERGEKELPITSRLDCLKEIIYVEIKSKITVSINWFGSTVDLQISYLNWCWPQILCSFSLSVVCIFFLYVACMYPVYLLFFCFVFCFVFLPSCLPVLENSSGERVLHIIIPKATSSVVRVQCKNNTHNNGICESKQGWKKMAEMLTLTFLLYKIYILCFLFCFLFKAHVILLWSFAYQC